MVWASADGYAWTRILGDQIPDDPVDASSARQQQFMRSVTAGGPGLVAVGSGSSGAAVWTSADGYSWSRVPADEAVLGDAGQRMESVAAGGSVIVAVSTRPCSMTCAAHEAGVAWVSPPAGP